MRWSGSASGDKVHRLMSPSGNTSSNRQGSTLGSSQCAVPGNTSTPSPLSTQVTGVPSWMRFLSTTSKGSSPWAPTQDNCAQPVRCL